MKFWDKVWFFVLVIVAIVLLMSILKRGVYRPSPYPRYPEESYMLLDSQAYDPINSDFAKNNQVEFCYDIGDRIIATHEMGFSPSKCASLSPKQFEFALHNVQLCEMSCINNSMDDTARKMCNAACFSREFERNPITDQAIPPLIMF